MDGPHLHAPNDQAHLNWSVNAQVLLFDSGQGRHLYMLLQTQEQNMGYMGNDVMP